MTIGTLNNISVDHKDNKVKRGLKSRHVQLIAIGGCIGTGLFVGSGAILVHSGPASMFLAYVILSFVMWVVMNGLGEMTTYLPIDGVSPVMFIRRFTDKSLGWAAGWMYWYAYAFLVPSEITAAVSLVDFWTDKLPHAALIAICIFLIVLLNLTSVKYFGESEFWFAFIKIIAITGLIFLGVILFFWGGPNQSRLGFRYWKHDQAFQSFLVSGASGRFCGFWEACVRAGFSFILSPEFIAVSAGECEAPRRNIPKAVGRFVFRISFFYIFGSLVIGIIVSSYRKEDVDKLIGGTGALASPFVVGIENAGIKILPHIMNAAFLTSALSCANAMTYSGSRILYSMAINGDAPKFLGHANRFGTPLSAVACTLAVSCLAFLTVGNSSAVVFTWFTNLSTIAGFIGWICLLVTYIRWRKAMSFQGLLHTRTYVTMGQPHTTYIVLGFLIILTLTNGFSVFVGHSFEASKFIAAYITLPIFVVLYIGHKLWTKNWTIFIPLDQVDLVTGLEEVLALDAMDTERKPTTILQKMWYYIA